MELIDRAALDVVIVLLQDETPLSVVLNDQVRTAPTIDAVPVVHAYWADAQEGDGGNVDCSCSNCYAGETHSPKVIVPYCWKCGARMDADAPERGRED